MFIWKNDRVGVESRAGQTVLRATITERMQPGVVFTTFHFSELGANMITTETFNRTQLRLLAQGQAAGLHPGRDVVMAK
jgi:predicted molibdopterin-dependent oxidoreductase YjgC